MSNLLTVFAHIVGMLAVLICDIAMVRGVLQLWLVLMEAGLLAWDMALAALHCSSPLLPLLLFFFSSLLLVLIVYPQCSSLGWYREV